MSKTASAYGRSSLARLAYNPVSGDLKSGIPALVLIPAPTMTAIVRALPSRMYSAMPSRFLVVRTVGGTDSSTGLLSSCPILKKWPGLCRGRYDPALDCLCCLCLRPMVAEFGSDLVKTCRRQRMEVSMIRKTEESSPNSRCSHSVYV